MGPIDKNIIFGQADNTTTVLGSDKPFSNFIYSQINVHGRNTFMVDGVSGKSLSFQEVHEQARAVAAALSELGVSPGETIAVSCENRFEYAVVLLASVYSCNTFAPINPVYSPDEIVHVLGISKPKVIFCSAFTCRNIATAFPSLSGVKNVVLFDELPGVQLPQFVKQFKPLLQTRPVDQPRESREQDVCVVLTSSGTTGLPKGVMLSFANMRFFCACATSSSFMNLKKQSVILGLLPLFHGYGYGLLMVSVIVGNQIVLLPKFEEKLFLSTVQTYKITNLYMVPPLMVFLAKHPMVRQYDLSTVREVVCGAAPLSREVTEEVRTRLPQAEVRQGYGMTESTIVITISPPRANKPESVGLLAPKCLAKIIDIETGKSLGRGKQGEIVIKGPCVMAGYCNDLKATRETLDPDGWMHTGDIGYVDDQGFFYIVDRIKELIKYKGYQVAPAELESLLHGIPGVSDAAVVGQPDLAAGELPIAFIVKQSNATLTEQQIMSHVNGKLSSQKHLRGVRFVDTIPRNPSGKVLRRILREGLKNKL